jgi:hypothetical protein
MEELSFTLCSPKGKTSVTIPGSSDGQQSFCRIQGASLNEMPSREAVYMTTVVERPTSKAHTPRVSGMGLSFLAEGFN